MGFDTAMYKTYCEILRQEPVPAMGCTEPIAIAYAAALAGQQLGGEPERIWAGLSGNIIKNVGQLARIGMRETDREIMRIMTGQGEQIDGGSGRQASGRGGA